MAARPNARTISAQTAISIGDEPVVGSEPPVMPLEPTNVDVVVTPAEAATVVVVTTGFNVLVVVVVGATVVVVVATPATVVVGATVVVVADKVVKLRMEPSVVPCALLPFIRK